jgi:hypothetical protein
MGAASQRPVSILDRQALHLEAHVIKRAAVPLDQRSILCGFPLKK